MGGGEEAVQRTLFEELQLPVLWQQLRHPQLLQSVCRRRRGGSRGDGGGRRGDEVGGWKEGIKYNKRSERDVLHTCSHTHMQFSLVARMPFLLACSPFIALPPPLATSPSNQSNEDRECTGDSCMQREAQREGRRGGGREREEERGRRGHIK